LRRSAKWGAKAAVENWESADRQLQEEESKSAEANSKFFFPRIWAFQRVRQESIQIDFFAALPN
jgi:hypothetical protein